MKTGNQTLNTFQGEVNPTAATATKKGNRTLNTFQGEVIPTVAIETKKGKYVEDGQSNLDHVSG